MTSTPVFGIPELVQGQNTPHATFNVAIALLSIIQGGVIDRGIDTPPVSPAPSEGDAYIVGTSPTGAWANRENCIAIYYGAQWRFIPGNDDDGTPITMAARQEGMRVYVRDENQVYVWANTLTSPNTYAWLPVFGYNGGDKFYEVGTWTPSLTFDTPGDLVFTPNLAHGVYVRFGNWIEASFTLTSSAFTHSTASGSFALTGLPFASRNESADRWHGDIAWDAITKANYTDIQTLLIPNTSQLRLIASGSGVVSSFISSADIPSGSTISFRGNIGYLRA